MERTSFLTPHHTWNEILTRPSISMQYFTFQFNCLFPQGAAIISILSFMALYVAPLISQGVFFLQGQHGQWDLKRAQQSLCTLRVWQQDRPGTACTSAER